jgi:hypothetical protein
VWRETVNLRARAKPWKTFFKKSFPNLSKNFNLKPLCGFRKDTCPFIIKKFQELVKISSKPFKKF